MLFETIDIFFVQLFGMVGLGSFVGEFQRSVNVETYTRAGFAANFLTSVFLSVLLAYSFYVLTGQKEISLIGGGLLAYQDEKFISKLSKAMAKNVFKANGNGGGHNDSNR